MWYYQKKEEKQMMELFKRKLANLMTLGCGRVAAGTVTKCCYFVFHQPEVPSNLKEFSKKRK